MCVSLCVYWGGGVSLRICCVLTAHVYSGCSVSTVHMGVCIDCVCLKAVWCVCVKVAMYGGDVV